MILRTAWIKRPILPGFCLNDPSAVGSSRQVTLLEDAAVVRGVRSQSLLTIRLRTHLLGGVKPKMWLVEIVLRCCGDFAGGN